MSNWEETDEYKKWRKDFPHAAEEYDKAKQKEEKWKQQKIARIREYKKISYSEMSVDDRRKHLKKLKKVYDKRKGKNK